MTMLYHIFISAKEVKQDLFKGNIFKTERSERLKWCAVQSAVISSVFFCFVFLFF